jgi:predicted GNAT family N-acyltransferase
MAVLSDPFLDLSTPRWRIRELQRAEELEAYDALRFEVLCSEIACCKSCVSEPAEMRDRFDPASRQIGVFSAGALIAAVRLVDGRESHGVPSAYQLPADWRRFADASAIGEVSRMVVARPHRNQGLSGRLLALSFAIARETGLDSLLISVRSDPVYAKYLGRFGFAPICEDYWYEDERIRPPVVTTTFITLWVGNVELYRQLLRR